MKNTFLDERIGSVVGIILKLPITSTTHGDLVLPSGKVESVEIIFENDSLGSIGSNSQS